MAADAGTGSKWLLGLLLYFLIYTIILFGVTNSMSYYGTSSGITYNSAFSSGFTEHCSDPRNTAGTYLFNDREADLSCNLITDVNRCNSFYNCEKRVTTTYLWFFTKDVPAYCANFNNDSNVGVSPAWLYNYGNSTLPTEVYGSDAGYLVNISASVVSGNDEISIASTPRILHNKTLCTTLGFTWSTPENPSKVSGVGWYEFIGIMSGFNTSLGLPQPWAFVFSLLFTWIPLVALLLVVRMLLPI